MTEAASAHPVSPAAAGLPVRRWLLLGAGPTHAELLLALAREPVAGVHITLLSTQPTQWFADRAAGFVAGHYMAEQCQWPLAPLVQRSGVQWLHATVRSLDTSARSVELDDGTVLTFDVLSIDVPGVHNRDQLEETLPGVREHALFAHPLASLYALWPRVQDMAQARPLRFTVVGASSTGTELACAIKYRFPQASVTLLVDAASKAEAGAGSGSALHQTLLGHLRQRNITLLQDRALRVSATSILLGCGAELATDVCVVATAKQIPRWLQHCGLLLGDDGLLAVDDFSRSASHPWVFVCGDAISTAHADTAATLAATHTPLAPLPPQRMAGDTLLKNMTASLTGQALQAHTLQDRGWRVLNLSPRNAIALWRGMRLQGFGVWWIKSWQESRWLARVSGPRPPPTPATAPTTSPPITPAD
jgi:NADH dehydrogenase FAD-containing subunit